MAFYLLSNGSEIIKPAMTFGKEPTLQEVVVRPDAHEKVYVWVHF